MLDEETGTKKETHEVSNSQTNSVGISSQVITTESDFFSPSQIWLAPLERLQSQVLSNPMSFYSSALS